METQTRFRGERLRAARKAKGISQASLANRIGASWSSITRWERGVNAPTGRHVAGICRELGITTEQLYDVEEEDESSDPVTDLTRAIDRYVDRKIAAAGG